MPTKTSPPPPPAPAPSGTRFFAWMRSLNIRREPGWIGGVAAGIATRLGVDPLIVRGIIVVVAVLGGPALLLYAAAWLLLPDENDKIHLEQLLRGVLESPIAGIGVLVLLSLLPVTQGFWYAGSAFWGEPFWGAALGRALWTIVLLGLAVWLVVWIARRASRPTVVPATTDARPSTIPQPAAPTPPPASAPAADFAAWREQQSAWKAENAAWRQQQNDERMAAWRAKHEETMKEQARLRALRAEENRRTRSNPLFSILVIGLALLAGGLTALAPGNGELDVTTVVAGLSVALAVLAVGMLINGIRGKRPGGAAGLAFVIVLPLLAFTFVPPNTHFQYANGAYFSPQDRLSHSPDIYVAGGGRVVIDLQDYYDNGLANDGEGWDSDNVYFFVGSGDVTLLLPNDDWSVVNASVLDGKVRVAGSDDDEGRTLETNFNQPKGTATQQLAVHVYLLHGTITITDPEDEK